MTLRRIFVAVAVTLTGMMLLRRRAVRTPDRAGSWQPID
jgi:hypothetical protein